MSLQELLNAQARLQKLMPPHRYALGYPLYGLNTNDQVIEFLTAMHVAQTDEMHEMLGEIGWKPWATSRHINRDAAVSEMVDEFHFFMNRLLALGVDEEELTRLYYAKHGKNAKRQREGYDGVSTKCPECHRAYDDDFVDCYPAVDYTTFPYCAQTGSYFV